MNLSEKLNAKTIIPQIKSELKQDVIQELLDHLYKLNYLTATSKLFTTLDSQEKQLSSASGRGIAYHYSTSIEVDKMVAVLGISKDGVDYQASDGLMCHFILLILEPEKEKNKHRILINLFQTMIKNQKIKSQILDLNLAKDIQDLIEKWENESLNDDII